MHARSSALSSTTSSALSHAASSAGTNAHVHHPAAARRHRGLPGTLTRGLLSAVLAVSGAAHVHAMGDASPAELPWVRPGADASVGVQGAQSAKSALGGQSARSGLTRAEVREALANARNADLMPGVSDIGETSEMLERREIFYALQTEVFFAELAKASSPELPASTDPLLTEVEAYRELLADGAHPAMLQPSANGTVITDAEGRETLVVEIDD